MDRDCIHGQLARSCALCQAAADIKAAYYEGYRDGFITGRDPSAKATIEIDYRGSAAKTNSESV